MQLLGVSRAKFSDDQHGYWWHRGPVAVSEGIPPTHTVYPLSQGGELCEIFADFGGLRRR